LTDDDVDRCGRLPACFSVLSTRQSVSLGFTTTGDGDRPGHTATATALAKGVVHAMMIPS
jgi:hypothetical protein